MRVTNKMLSNSFLSDMRTNLQNLQTLQQQMTSGKEIRRPSDDPVRVAKAMQLHTDINANNQYKKNISDTLNWLDTTDTALNQAGNVLQKVRELLVSAGNAAYGDSERSSIKDEIKQRIDEFAQILNTNFDGRYLFGGSRGTEKPLKANVAADGTNLDYSVNIDREAIKDSLNGSGIDETKIDSVINSFIANPDYSGADDEEKTIVTAINNYVTTEENKIDKKLVVEISPGVTMEYNVPANDILEFDGIDLRSLFSNIIDHLGGEGKPTKDEAIKAITGEDLDAITKTINNLIKVRAEVGAKYNRMESAKEKNEDETYNMTAILSRTEDIDITEKTMQYATLQTVYMASLQTSAKVLQPTLLDYLR